jgi:hypothetical protein
MWGVGWGGGLGTRQVMCALAGASRIARARHAWLVYVAVTVRAPLLCHEGLGGMSGCFQSASSA